jgi:hypothetical protein
MRKEKQYHFIYKTTNLLSGKYYIGMHSTDNLEDDYLGSGNRLRYSIKKYGKINHKREILEFCENRKELKSREKEIVNLNEIAKKECMNLCVGGEGGGFGHETINYQEYHKLGIYKNIQSLYNWNGKTHTEKTKLKISNSKKGQGVGSENSQYGTCWITNEKINKKIYRGDEIPKGFRLGRKLK